MIEGTVKWFNPKKGYGFIETDDGGGDVFVHISVVEKCGLDGLHAGEDVIFEVETDVKGRDQVVRIAPA